MTGTLELGIDPCDVPVAFSREWAMPSPATFSIRPISDLLARVCAGRSVIVDPFCAGSTLATHRNDLSPEHGVGKMEDQAYLRELINSGIRADCLLLDPPYSPRQMAEVYKSVGINKGMAGSQNAALYSECKDLMTRLASPKAIAVTFGWSSAGFGKKRGFALREVMLVCHGGAHNDTIVTVEEYTR